MTRVAVVTGAARGHRCGDRRGAGRAPAGPSWRWTAARDDPRLPYRLGTEDELAAAVERARAAAGDAARVRHVVGDAASAGDMGAAVALAETAYGGLDA